jgi:hypothetical protein
VTEWSNLTRNPWTWVLPRRDSALFRVFARSFPRKRRIGKVRAGFAGEGLRRAYTSENLPVPVSDIGETGPSARSFSPTPTAFSIDFGADSELAIFRIVF